MWRLTVSLALIFVVNAFAETTVPRQFTIEKAQYSSAHVQTPTTGSLTVDYDLNEVTLEVNQAMSPCPADRNCAQVMPDPLIVKLPIKSTERGNCGIIHVIAEQDFRPNDGALEQISLDDTTEMNCGTTDGFTANATYETRIYDRVHQKEIVETSKMVITPAITALFLAPGEQLKMVKGTFLKGFPSYQVPGSGTLVLNGQKILMRININMDCSQRFCPRILPLPLYMELPIVKVEHIGCAKILTARKDQRAVDGTLEEVEIKDYSQSVCANGAPNSVEVHYHSALQRGSGLVEYEADFTFVRN